MKKGNVFITTGEYNQALGCYDHALEINPDFEDAWDSKGKTLAELGRYGEALECFERAPDGAFDLNLPEGVLVEQVEIETSQFSTIKEAQLEVPFPLRTPSQLPAGTAFSVAYKLDSNLALVYTGERSFTLVQGPGIGQVPQVGAMTISVRGQQATLIPDPEHAGMVLTWREDELQFSISGSLERSEIVQLAESLELASGASPEAEAEPEKDAP